MATNSAQGKWDHVEEEEEDEEEALSLCDLPVKLINDEDQIQSRKENSQVIETQEEEFDFCSLGGLFSNESAEMCAADEVFYQGQILPLCLSFGSQRDGQQFNRSKSMSESPNHGSSLIEFWSNNSRRSSSIGSHNSSSSNSTSSTTTTTPIRISKSKPKVQNQFNTHPSPKPRLIKSVPRRASFGNQGRKSSASAWEFFRLGVVPTPEIALPDLKVRSTNGANKNSVSRNSSSSSSSSTTKSVKMSNETHHNGKSKSNHFFKQFVSKGGGLLSGCKCSIETVPLDKVMIKGGTKSTNKTESTTHAMKETVLELKKKQKHNAKQGIKVMSRRRTFEWIEELHAISHPDEKALLSNS